MTATLTTHAVRQHVTGFEEVREASTRLLTMLTARGLDDPRWELAGPLVSATASRLRAALGVPTVATGPDVPPVVRERDLAAAAHHLLARDARVVDSDAAGAFVDAAAQLSLAFA